MALLTKCLFSCRCTIGTQFEGFLPFQNFAIGLFPFGVGFTEMLAVVGSPCEL